MSMCRGRIRKKRSLLCSILSVWVWVLHGVGAAAAGTQVAATAAVESTVRYSGTTARGPEAGEAGSERGGRHGGAAKADVEVGRPSAASNRLLQARRW